MTTSSLIGLFALVLIIQILADVLNLKTAKSPLPVSLQKVQTPDVQKRAAQYLKDRVVFSSIRSIIFFSVFCLMLTQGIFGWLQETVIHHADTPLLQSLLFVGVLGVGQALLSIPFQLYSTFKIEADYGFNRTSALTFVLDLLKGALVAIILGAPLFSFVVMMLEKQGDNAWWMIWLGFTAFQFFLVWIAPVTLLPLFMKLSPLPEGELKDAIESYAKKQSFKLNGVWISDASKRSAKSNAFFTGFGKFRRLVLFDTLVANHTPSEIVAIVAHEAGHFKLGHIWKMSLFSSVTSLAYFFLLQQLINLDSLYATFQTNSGIKGMGLVLSAIVFNKVLFFLSPFGTYFSRRNEYAADRFSVNTTHDAASMTSGLTRLVSDNLSTLQHHPLYTLLHDSHPPLPDRLKAIEEI